MSANAVSLDLTLPELRHLFVCLVDVDPEPASANEHNALAEKVAGAIAAVEDPRSGERIRKNEQFHQLLHDIGL